MAAALALPLFVALAVGLSFVSAIYGFGTALFLLSIGAFILPIKQAIALSTVLFAAATLAKSWLFRHEIDWLLAFKVTLVSAPMAYAGALVLDWLPADTLRRCLGLLVLSYVALNWSGWRPSLSRSTALAYPAAGLYGFLSGSLGSGHVVKVVFFQAIGIAQGAFVGIMAATAVLNNTTKLWAYHDQGLLGAGATWAMAVLAIGGVVTALLGRRFVIKISERHFMVAVRVLLTLAGGALLVL